MKIDLHLHTNFSRRNGDTILWTDLNKVLRTLISYDIKIASFTDHNYFDSTLYIEARRLALTGGLILLPGIEINVVRKNGTIAHMLILFDNMLSDGDLISIEKDTKAIFKNGVHISQINNLFSQYKTIRIIHVGKNDYFTIEDLDGLEYDAFEITNYNHSNFVKFNNANISSSVVAFSDTHNWDKYPQCSALATDIKHLQNPTFNNLKIALSENKDYTYER